MDDTAATNATHFEARDQAPPKEEKPKAEPKKRGRKPKEEREQWLIEQAEKEAQLVVPLSELRAEVPQDPKWGVKKNSEGKNVYWYGYKGHLAVGTSSQYILQSLFSSGNLNDGKAAIPLLKGMDECLSLPSLNYQTWTQVMTMIQFTNNFIEWETNLSLLTIRKMKGSLLASINTLPQPVSGSILIVMIVSMPNTKR